MQDNSQEVFPEATVAQAIANISDAIGCGVLDDVQPNKLVLEASYRVLDRRFGKPRETLELSHKIALRIDVPGWGALPAPNNVIDAVLGEQT